MVGDTSLTAELLLREINTVGMELLRIPAGTFIMGDIAGTGDEDERPVHQVTLSHDYYISKFETTQGEYKAVMGSGANIRPCGFSGDDRLPFERISWFEAIRFANTMSESEGLAPCYHTDGSVIDGSGNPYECEGYRLPMEAEWEYAARAGTTTSYSFGDDVRDLDRYAWYSGNADSRTHPVGEKLPNPWGLFDVHGNVDEWIFDRISNSYYSWSPDVDPYGPGSGSDRVLRGGSWLTGGYRSTERAGTDPTMYNSSWGIRLARTAN